MQIIDNQPAKFDQVLNTCHLDYTRYKQLVKLGDVTNFQVKIGDCPLPENKIVNGGFATNLNGWTQAPSFGWFWDDGKACNVAPGAQDIGQSTLNVGAFYRIEVTVTDLVSTDVNDLNSGRIDVQVGFNQVARIAENGVYVLYGVCTFINELRFFKTANTRVCIDDVVALEIDINHIVAIFDENNNFILDLKVTDFIDEFTFITDEFTLIQNFLTGFIDWTALSIPAGCYKICLLDACVNTNFQNFLPNGEFNISPASPFVEWTFSSGFLATIAGKLKYAAAAPLATDNVSQVGIKSGCSYEIIIKINSIADCEVWVMLGSNITTKWTGAGTFTETVAANGTGIAIHFEGTDGIDSPEAEIEYVRLKISPTCYETDFCSPIFDVRAAHDCTLRINACDDPRLVDDMGFLFKLTGFNPTIRLHSKLVNSQYKHERDVVENSFGRRAVAFYQRRKQKTLKISRQPEYVHDFLSLLFGFDHISIGIQEYVVVSDEYLLTYDKEDNFARSQIDVTEKVELTRNTLCQSEGNHGPCQIDDNFIIDPEGGGPLLKPDDDIPIEIPG